MKRYDRKLLRDSFYYFIAFHWSWLKKIQSNALSRLRFALFHTEIFRPFKFSLRKYYSLRRTKSTNATSNNLIWPQFYDTDTTKEVVLIWYVTHLHPLIWVWKRYGLVWDWGVSCRPEHSRNWKLIKI